MASGKGGGGHLLFSSAFFFSHFHIFSPNNIGWYFFHPVVSEMRYFLICTVSKYTIPRKWQNKLTVELAQERGQQIGHSPPPSSSDTAGPCSANYLPTGPVGRKRWNAVVLGWVAESRCRVATTPIWPYSQDRVWQPRLLRTSDLHRNFYLKKKTNKKHG
jgi:hypothetical protein